MVADIEIHDQSVKGICTNVSWVLIAASFFSPFPDGLMNELKVELMYELDEVDPLTPND